MLYFLIFVAAHSWSFFRPISLEPHVVLFHLLCSPQLYNSTFSSQSSLGAGKWCFSSSMGLQLSCETHSETFELSAVICTFLLLLLSSGSSAGLCMSMSLQLSCGTLLYVHLSLRLSRGQPRPELPTGPQGHCPAPVSSAAAPFQYSPTSPRCLPPAEAWPSPASPPLPPPPPGCCCPTP